VFKCIEDALELLALELTDQPLGMSISISTAMLLQSACGLQSKLKSNGKYVFAKSLLGATIQDGGIRERSVLLLSLPLQFKSFAINLFSRARPIFQKIGAFLSY